MKSLSDTDIKQAGGVKIKPDPRGFNNLTTTGEDDCTSVPSPTDISLILEIAYWYTLGFLISYILFNK